MFLHVDRPNLIETLPIPLALVSSAGTARECNTAFRELARSCNAPLELTALFGSDVRPLLEGARTTPLEATLPLVARSQPRRWFRIHLSPHDDGLSWTAVLSDVSEEAAFHRRHRDCDREFHLLREIGASLSECVDLESITERVCDQVVRLTRTRSFYVALHDRERDMVSFPRYLDEGEWREKVSRPFSNGLTEHVLRTGTPLVLNGDVFERARELGIEPMGPSCRSWLGVPMIANGRVVGAIAVQNAERAGCFDQREIALLGIIAGQAAAAVLHAGLHSASRRAYQDLSETQARLLESERVRGITEAVGAMNHEINNPLAAIVGNAQLLLRRKETAALSIGPKVESILAAARRIQEVTGKMSTLIQATSMPYPGDATILDLRRSVAEGETCRLLPSEPRLDA
jgi:hypothetical protein